MEELMGKMSRLDTRELSSHEFQMTVLTALEEVTEQQQRIRRMLDRLVRRGNREEVRHLLDQAESDPESAESGQIGYYGGETLNWANLFYSRIQFTVFGNLIKQFIFENKTKIHQLFDKSSQKFSS